MWQSLRRSFWSSFSLKNLLWYRSTESDWARHTTDMKPRPRAALGLPLSTSFAATFVSSLLLLYLQFPQAKSAREKMRWEPALNDAALCNDFTRAGFFIRRNINSDNWLVFLESGGLCYDRDSCNRRFFVRQVSRRSFLNCSCSVAKQLQTVVTSNKVTSTT